MRVLFNSVEFAVFLLAVLVLHWTVPGRWQNRLLLTASYVFYGAWDARFLVLLLLSTGTDYVVARRMDATDDVGRRRRLLWVSLGVNLSVLGFFKYFDFFVTSGAQFLEMIGLPASPPTLRVLLPVGISFYTFQTMSYTFDVYRRRIRAERDLLDFALFVSFFPQLVAGPIERASHLLPQLKRPRTLPRDGRFGSGLVLILQGLFRKVVIADSVAWVAAETGQRPLGQTSAMLWLGILAFMVQFYGDFAGYTDIARGTARLLGIDLVPNFEQPLLARSFTEFWQRWHVTLSSWLHDYVFDPLRRRLPGDAGAAAAALVTMTAAGLWHGATTVFVVWGMVHGLLLVLERALPWKPFTAKDPFRPRHLLTVAWKMPLWGLTFVLVQTGSLQLTAAYWWRALTFVPGKPEGDALVLVVTAYVLSLGLDLVQRRLHTQEPLLAWAPPARGLAYGAMGVGVLAFSGGVAEPFVYFQF